MSTYIEYVAPVKGAAGYFAKGCNVWMITPEGDESVIDSKRTYELAQKAAVRWQKKENKAVTKANKSSQGAI